MGIVTRITAWICIVTTVMTGCTSVSMVNTEGRNADELYNGDIEIVVTKDGTKYEFKDSQTVTITAGVIRGVSGGKVVAIPLSDVSKVYVRTNDALLTILAAVGVVVVVGFIVVGSALHDCHEDFETMKK